MNVPMMMRKSKNGEKTLVSKAERG